MLAFLADENFHGAVVAGLRRRLPHLDLLRVQDAGLMSLPDPELLEWAAQRGRLLLTHDVRTIPRFVQDRLAAGLGTPGVVEVPAGLPVRRAIEEIVLLATCSFDNEWENLIVHIPLR